MAAATIGGGILEAVPLNAAGIVGRQFEFLDRHRKLRRSVERGQAVGAQREFGAKALAGPHAARPLDDRLSGTELQRRTIDLVRGQDSPLVHLHGAGDGGPGRDRVESVLIAQVIRLDDRFQFVDAAIGAIGPKGLILGAFAFHAVETAVAAAGDRAPEAGGFLDQVRLRQMLAGNLVGRFETAFLKVSGRIRAQLIHHVHQDRGAVGRQSLSRYAIFPDDLDQTADNFLSPDWIGGLNPFAAAHDDGLEVLAPEHRTDAGAAGGTVLVVHHGSDRRAPFSGRPYGQHTGFGVADLLL